MMSVVETIKLDDSPLADPLSDLAVVIEGLALQLSLSLHSLYCLRHAM